VFIDRTLDFSTDNYSERVDAFIAISSLTNRVERETVPSIPIDKSTMIKLNFRFKIEGMMKERCLKLNELFFLAMYRTAKELNFSEQK
jgi:hypothetical protein